MEKEMTLEEAEKIVDDMYQKRWIECGVEDGNTIHMGNLDKLQYSELERASILLLRTEIRLQSQLKKQKEINKKAIEYIKSKENGKCIHNGIEKGAYTFVLDFDETREFIWELLQILEDKGD